MPLRIAHHTNAIAPCMEPALFSPEGATWARSGAAPKLKAESRRNLRRPVRKKVFLI